MRRHVISGSLLLLGLTLLAGCGQKGPLFMPGVKPDSAVPAPAASAAAPATSARPAAAASAPPPDASSGAS